MRAVALGHTGVEVSAFCLGGLHFGSLLDDAASFAILDAYRDAGGRFLDTANIYAGWLEGFQGGESEAAIGRWLRARGCRAEMFIATKVGGALHRGNIIFNQPGLRAAHIAAECERSLTRLGVETIDLYYAHVDDRGTPLEESLEAFDRLVRAGKVRFIGASNTAAWRLERAYHIAKVHGWPKYCCIQQRFTYLRPNPGADFSPQVAANDDLLDLCAAQGVTLLAYTPLLQGAYARPDDPLPPEYRGPDSAARLAALRHVAAEHGATLNQVVLAWLMQNRPPAIPVVGVETPAQLDENLGALGLALTPAQIERLNAAGA